MKYLKRILEFNSEYLKTYEAYNNYNDISYGNFKVGDLVLHKKLAPHTYQEISSYVPSNICEVLPDDNYSIDIDIIMKIQYTSNMNINYVDKLDYIKIGDWDKYSDFIKNTNKYNL